MARALQLAARGEYTAHPNPMVGCVLAQDGEVVGEGWHQRAGEAHAEVNALQSAGDAARGAVAYVTLEPCAHHGKTPPCADALIEAGIARAVVAMQDPFGEVAGRGIAILEAAGIPVAVGLMQAEAQALNRGFIARVTRQRPFVQLKIAASMDGAIAMQSGESQWITGPAARADVQHLRARAGAVMTGIGTALADDPALNVRAAEIDTGDRQPLRVVLDSDLRMPATARMLTLPGHTLICCTGRHATAALEATGAEVRAYASADGLVDVNEVLADLAAREINDVLVEAGPRIAGHLLENELVDELVIYQAPHIMGSQTIGMFETPGWTRLVDRRKLDITDVRRIGDDTRIVARIEARTGN